jgi:Ca2+/Na+ antiporter
MPVGRIRVGAAVICQKCGKKSSKDRSPLAQAGRTTVRIGYYLVLPAIIILLVIFFLHPENEMQIRRGLMLSVFFPWIVGTLILMVTEILPERFRHFRCDACGNEE